MNDSFLQLVLIVDIAFGVFFILVLYIAPRKWVMKISVQDRKVLKLFEGKPPEKVWLNQFGLICYYGAFTCVFILFLVSGYLSINK